MMQMRMRAAAALIVAVLAACEESSLGPRSRTQLRVVHAAATKPNVDVLVAGSPEVENVGYRGTSPYRDVLSGKPSLTVRQTGTTATLHESRPTLMRDWRYTAVVVSAGNDVSTLVLLDNPTLAPGKAQLRVVNAAPAANTVEVYVTAPYADLSTLAPNAVDLRQNKATFHLPVDPGTHHVRFTSAWSKTVVFDAGFITLASGDARTLVILDKPGGGTPIEKVILTDR